jgi:GNAT superfamily N-acetyltransferase
MRIRLASEADIGEMQRVRMQVRENRLLNAARVLPSDYHRMLTADGRGWVADIADRVVGFAIADLSRANIWALFVDPDFQGRGIGRGLHDKMVHWLFEAGVDPLWLSTEPGTRAEGFYEAAGWRRTGFQEGELRFELSREAWLFRVGSRMEPDRGLQGMPGCP